MNLLVLILLVGPVQDVEGEKSTFGDSQGVEGFFEGEGSGDRLGTALWLRPDGQWRRGLVGMLDGEYRYENGTLVVTLDGEETRLRVSVEGDRLVGRTPPEVAARRVGEAPLNDEIAGIWEYERLNGETAYERFLKNGQLQFRLPSRSTVRGGQYVIEGEELRLTAGEETVTARLSGDGNELDLSGTRLRRVGERPWYRFEEEVVRKAEILERLDPRPPPRDLEDARRRTIEGALADWERCLVSIREQGEGSPEALSVPQLGLVPLRRDPSSGLWEFWHPESGARPELDPAAERWQIRPEMGMVFVLVPRGTALLGEPPHGATIEPLFLSKYELTVEQYDRMAGISGKYPAPPLSPWMEMDLWRISVAERVLGHMGLRLPTCDEWEYCARGGTTTTWWTGDEPESLRGAANLCDRSYRVQIGGIGAHAEWLDDGFAGWAPIGQFAPNPFGFHDILGNATEGAVDGLHGDRVVARGGCYLSLPERARSVDMQTPGQAPGVRPARSVETP